MAHRRPDRSRPHPWTGLQPRARKSKAVRIVIETVQGSPNKFRLDPRRGVFKLTAVLPAGASFPYDFGFVPGTLGEDGDPLDVLVLMDAPTFPGCVISGRLVGVIEAEQGEKTGGRIRNDRLIAIARESGRHESVRNLADLDTTLLAEIEHFFVNYNEMKGRTFRVCGRGDAAAAERLVDEGHTRSRGLHPRSK